MSPAPPFKFILQRPAGCFQDLLNLEQFLCRRTVHLFVQRRRSCRCYQRQSRLRALGLPLPLDNGHTLLLLNMRPYLASKWRTPFAPSDLHLHMCIYICIYMHICIFYIYIHVCMHVCTPRYTCFVLLLYAGPPGAFRQSLGSAGSPGGLPPTCRKYHSILHYSIV